MKAAVFKNILQIEVQEVEKPSIQDNEVLIKVAACGICGSDMHMYRTDTHRHLLNRITEAGWEIPGHEYSGEIVELGAGVEGFAIGDRVVGVGMGGFAEYVPVSNNPYQLVKIPDSVSYQEAATTEPLADSLQMVRKAEPKEGDNIVVYGVGIIGLGVIQALLAADVKIANIVAIDVSGSRLKMASDLGAKTVNAAKENVIEGVRAFVGSAPTEWPPTNPTAVDIVIDCAGYIQSMKGKAPLQNALEMIRENGRIICFGAYEGSLNIDFMPVIEKQITIQGSVGYASEELVDALEMMASKKLDRASLISHTFPIDQVGKAFETQGSPGAIKVLVVPE